MSGLVYLFVGLLLGGIMGWYFAKNQSAFHKKELEEQIMALEKGAISRIGEIDKEKGIIEERLNLITEQKETAVAQLEEEREKTLSQSSRLAKAESEYRNLQEKLETQKSDFEDLQKKFTAEFRNMANDILKQHSQEFTQTNQKNIGDILNPLKEKIKEFENSVNQKHESAVKDNASLKQEIKGLFDLNQKLSQDAENLTKALKGDVKKQGNWGEVILERVLERSGLTRGVEYETQYTARNEQGDMLRPDVIIHLPDNKHIIVDSKVTLVAYEAFSNADSQEAKDRYLKQHVDAVKNHIKLLSEKNYQNVASFDTPDFVLLFMPIESAFSAAIQADLELFGYAWDRKIVIVSPSTLLATLRTVSSIWKQEKQTQNALEIARQGGALYDKFIAFLADLEKMGTQLNTLQNTYGDAHKRLSSGNGNLITRVEKLRELGAKTTKNLPDKYQTSGSLFIENDNQPI